MSSTRIALLTVFTAIIACVSGASAGDSILSGSISSAAGAKLGGVTVSAKPVGGTIATTVFTDESGDY
jgi:hypothetical protein